MDGGLFLASFSAIARASITGGVLIVDTAIKLVVISAGMLGVAGVAWIMAEKWKL